MNRRLAFALLAAGLLAAATVPGCGGSSNEKPAGTASTGADGAGRPSLVGVAVQDNRFLPTQLTVPVGSKITWDWEGSNAHGVVGKWAGQEVKSGEQQAGGSFSFTFEKAGTFDYQCSVHGTAMRAKVIVK